MSLVQEPIGDHTKKWPYPVLYGDEHEVSADVLIIGGGIAGCHAALHAARRGATVAVVDKASIRRSGSGGAGVDHWGGAYTNPCSRTTPDEAVAMMEGMSGIVPGGMEVMAKYEEKLKDLDGFPLISEITVNAEGEEQPLMKMETRIENIRSARLKNSEFEIPEGFKKLEGSPNLMKED